MNQIISKYLFKRSYYVGKLVQYEELLHSGVYFLTVDNYKFKWKRIKSLRDIFVCYDKIPIGYFIRILAYKSWHIVRKSGNDNESSGEELLISRIGDVRIFDYVNNLFLECFSDSAIYDKYKRVVNSDLYKKLSSPQLIKTDDRLQIMFFRLLNNNDVVKWHESDENVDKFVEWLCNNLPSAHSTCDTVTNIQKIFGSIRREYPDRFDKIANIYKHITVNEKYMGLSRYIHGDLVLYNVMMTDNGFCVVDYDDAREGPVFLDLFYWFIYSAFGRYRIEKHLARFIKGDFDNFYAKAFTAYGFVYHEEKKIDYVYNTILFLIGFLNKNSFTEHLVDLLVSGEVKEVIMSYVE